MGIARGVARLLIEESHSRPFQGSLLQLGRCAIFCTYPEFRSWSRAHQVELAPVSVGISHDPRLARLGCIDDQTFFRSLGFADVRSCDVSSLEAPDYLMDLNEPVPPRMKERFDVIFDCGTLPQVFHLPNQLANIHNMLKPGGRIIHAMNDSSVPVDHAFFFLGPGFFWEYYNSNSYRIESSYFYRFSPYWHRGRLHAAEWLIHGYTPGCLSKVTYSQFLRRNVGIFLVATKVADSTGDRRPQIRYYREWWRETGAALAEGVGGVESLAASDPGATARRNAPVTLFPESWTSSAAAWELFLEKHPLIDRAYLRLKRLKRRLKDLLPAKLPPIVARY